MSITVNAASYDYPYIACRTDSSGKSVIYLSQDPIHVYVSQSRVNNYDSPYYYYIGHITSRNVIRLIYNEPLSQWQTESILTPGSSNNLYLIGERTAFNNPSFVNVKSGLYGSSIYQIYSIITNSAMSSLEQSAFTSFSTDLTQLPQGITEDAIRDIINEQLNTMSSAGQTAQTVINSTTNQYNHYLSGDINSATMQQNVTNNIDTLSSLSPSTLLDAMQINNGLTYNQSIQDQLLNTASGNVQSMINGYTNTITNAVNNYTSGAVNQADTVTIIRQTITNLNNLITNGTATTTADIAAVNAAINAANSSMDSVTGYKDLDTDVSEKVQQSDEEEIEYLEELTADATSTITDIAPSQNFTASQTGDAQEVMDLIWENEFVKRLLPMCAGFMVVCVVLGIRYKV